MGSSLVADEGTKAAVSRLTPAVKWGGLVFAVALLVRLLGIQWGLANGLHNQSFHPDEDVNWRYSQLMDPAHGNFTPGFYGYGTLYFTLLNVSTSVTAAYTGAPKAGSEDWAFISRCLLAGRILSALFGAGLAVCAFAMAWLAGGQIAAWIAGGMLAFSPGLVVHSRFATVDMLAAMLIGLAGVCAFKLIADADLDRRAVIRLALLGGIYAGLSAGTKYTGILAIFMIWAALGLVHRTHFWRGLLVSLGAAVAAFVISTPGCVLDSKRFIAGVMEEMVHTSTGHGLVFVGTSNGFVFQISNLILGVGFLCTAAGGIWLVWRGYKKAAWALVLLAFALPTYILIGRSAVKFYRYSIPLAIPIAVSIGLLASEADRTQWKGKAALALSGCAVVGIFGGGLRGTSTFTAAMMSQDPRDQAGAYLKANTAKGEQVGLVSDPWFWSPSVFPNTGLARMVPFQVRDHFRAVASNPTVVQYVPPDPGQRLQWDPRLITDLSPEYITFSDFEYSDFARLSAEGNPGHNVDVDRWRAFMDLLRKHYRLEKVFGYQTDLVEDLRYVMPTVYVWKRNSPTS